MQTSRVRPVVQGHLASKTDSMNDTVASSEPLPCSSNRRQNQLLKSKPVFLKAGTSSAASTCRAEGSGGHQKGAGSPIASPSPSSQLSEGLLLRSPRACLARRPQKYTRATMLQGFFGCRGIGLPGQKKSSRAHIRRRCAFSTRRLAKLPPSFRSFLEPDRKADSLTVRKLESQARKPTKLQ